MITQENIINVEVCIKANCSSRFDSILNSLEEYLKSHFEFLAVGLRLKVFMNPFLDKVLDWILICESISSISTVKDAKFNFYPFQFQNEEEYTVDQTINAIINTLPCNFLDGLWESLVFDGNLPLDLYYFIQTGLLFSDLDVNTNIINVNKLILLYGPPGNLFYFIKIGTGKTSLCKALAQKCAIRNSNRFSYGKLIEINAHSLFSKYFSESGKLVQKMFDQIQKIVDDDDYFVCILMDEVESLTASRKSVLSGLEPSDALRVVNALLTQIDKYRNRKNVLILATSNLVDAIDPAFLDRVDIKQYIGTPCSHAIYDILSSTLQELISKGLIKNPSTNSLLSWDELEVGSPTSENSLLVDLSKQCEGMSGRTLRKLAFLAHARYIQHVF